MNFCSNCGAPVERLVPPDDDRPRYVCKACRSVHYQNPRIVVGCIPEWEDKILICRRNITPQKGKWTLPAGYLENGESVEEGARRETLEETGAVVKDLSPYRLFDIPHINQIYLMFRGRMNTLRYNTTRESDRVLLMEEDKIPWNQIAFAAIEKTLTHYFRDRPMNRFPFRIHRINNRLV